MSYATRWTMLCLCIAALITINGSLYPPHSVAFAQAPTQPAAPQSGSGAHAAPVHLADHAPHGRTLQQQQTSAPASGVTLASSAQNPSNQNPNNQAPNSATATGGAAIELGDRGPVLTGGAAPFGTCNFPCTGTPEVESCGAVLNNGCNISPLSPSNFITGTCGQTYCGTLWAAGGMRDSDFYRFQPTQVTTISATVTSNLPLMVALLGDSGGDCFGVDIIDNAFNTGDCGTVTLTVTVPGGNYYVFLAPDPGNGTGLFNFLPCGGSNDYELTVTCTAPPCQLSGSGILENETPPAATNNGCDATPVVTASIASGQTIHGTTWASGGSRDSDWYEFSVAGAAQTVDVSLTSEFPGVVYLLEASCGGGPTLAAGASSACNPGSFSTILGAGSYVLVVTPGDAQFNLTTDGIPVGDPANEYLLTLDTTPVVPGCSLGCTGTPEPDACGDTTDNGCIAGAFLPLVPDGPTSCGTIFASNGSRDIDWYSFGLPVDTTITLTVQSQFPAQLVLGRCGSTPGSVIFINETNGLDCHVSPAVITATLSAGSYVAVVTIGDGPIGIGDITTGFPCSGNNTEYSCTLTTTNQGTCDLVCSSPAESETCGQVINNGCNLPTPSFEPLAIGDTRCGTLWADGNDRDSDWWEFTLAAPTSVSWSVAAELPVRTFLLSGIPDGCDTPGSIVGSLSVTGDCMPTSSGTIDLPCGTHYLFFAPGNASGSGIFTGFPCGSGRNDYEFTLNGAPSSACLEPTITLGTDCAAGTIDVEVGIAQCMTGTLFRVTDPQGFQVSLQSLPGTLNACTVIPIALGPFTTGGVYTIEVEGNCCAGGTVQVVAEVLLPLYSGETEIIWNAPPNNSALPVGYAGTIPSEILLNNILEAPPYNADVLVIEDLLGFDCVADMGPGDTLWVLLGTFPDNHALREAEGQLLVDLLLAGVSVYIEGADVWGFDLATVFADYDGVLGRAGTAPDTVNFDGDDSYTSMSGGVHGDLDLTAFTAVPYVQDNMDPTVGGGNDSTDRLNPTQSGLGVDADLAGTNAGAIWFNNPDGNPDPLITEAAYATAIYYLPANPCQGRVIAQSWEYGGFGGNLTNLAGDYLTQLKNLQPGTSGFIRGNCNNDDSTNIADVVFLLTFLFTTGAPAPDCEDACDSNDDGSMNIADAISLLSALFNNPAPPLPDPLCDCGPDPTADALDCLNYAGLDCL